MAEEKQPPGVVEGATTGDVEDEMLDDKAKSAEDRKAAAALSKLDARGDDDDDAKAAGSVDQEGLSKAMNKLGVSKKEQTVKTAVKVDKEDVQLLVSWLCFLVCSRSKEGGFIIGRELTSSRFRLRWMSLT